MQHAHPKTKNVVFPSFSYGIFENPFTTHISCSVSVVRTQKHLVHPTPPTLFLINPPTEFIIFNVYVNSQFILPIVFPHTLATSLISSDQVHLLPSIFIFILILFFLFKPAYPLFGFHVQTLVVNSSQSLFPPSFANH